MQDLLPATGLPQGAGMAWLLAGAVAAGLARGFSGFGTALIFVPVAAMALGPRHAVPLYLAIDAFAVAALTPAAWRIADRREAALLAFGLLPGIPLGAAILFSLDALTLRWVICLLILGLLALIMSGWRIRWRPSWPLTIAVGAAGGVMNGVAAIGGPPVMAYLLGRGVDAKGVRAAFTVFIAAATTLTGIAFAFAGLFGAWLLGPLAIALPGYLIGVWGGSKLFGLASDLAFRRVTYVMIVAAAVLSLPLVDSASR